MAILTEKALDFAKEHITKYYDSDFFPKPAEFEALWYQWADVKAELMSKNTGKLWITPPRAMTIRKPKTGFRVVHQLEPVDAVVYSALACEIAESVEAARAPISEYIACSYRLSVSDGSYFSTGSGWTDFGKKTEELAGKFKLVLVTDITDFYNQIYLHRLNNAIESANPKLKPVAADIEHFLSTLNSKSSQGIPVGPAASIVMAEAVLIDVDQFLKDQGIAHTRYVDDMRIFSDSTGELNRVLDRLTLYLYENHRLTVSSEKTFVTSALSFVKKFLHNDKTEEKVQLLQKLQVFNPYTEEVEEVEVEVDHEDAIQQAQLIATIEKILEYDYVDLSLARSVIRTARRNSLPVLASHLLENFEFFAPVVNDVALYMHEVTDAVLAKKLRPLIEALLGSPALDHPLSRLWFEWYVAQHAEFMQSPKIHKYVLSGPNIENHALAAITTKNVAWVRSHKTNVYNLGGWARRAVLNASRVLPSDERTHWLNMFIGNSPVVLDRWVAKWVRETS